MHKKKPRPIIAAEQITDKFNDAKLAQLAKIAKLPDGADMAAWAEGIREAARIFVRDAGLPGRNELHDEIGTLYKAAADYQYEKVATLMQSLSARSRDALTNRGALPSVATELPAHDTLRAPAQRDAACETIARLCQFGGKYVPGRRRPLGKQSRPTWSPLLSAPDKQANFAKRAAERTFVINLRIAWLQATGEPPSRTAHHDNHGPFAKFVRECLDLVGAKDASPVDLINEVDRRHREMEAEIERRNARPSE
jgi:hypothetical protein